MNSPWDDSRSVKFSRDDDQIFALNYENLCDIDYLNKLFSAEAPLEPEQLSSHPWMLSPDLPEDILLFGRQAKVGLEYLYQRSLYDDSSQSRMLDSHADVILRQIKVFAHIGCMVKHKCSLLKRTGCSVNDAKLKVRPQSLHFLPNALTCALHMIRNNSKKSFSRSSLHSIVSLISEIFQNSSNSCPSSGLNFKMLPIHAHLLRTALCMGMQHGMSVPNDNPSHSPEEILQSLKLSMSSAFCLFKFGLYLHSSSDVLLALSHMLAMSVCIEDQRVELEAQIASIDSELHIQDKSRKKAKLRESRLNGKNSSLVPPQNNEDLPTRDTMCGFDIKQGFEKTSWEKPILKSATGNDWKAKLQIKKSAVRPERDGEFGVYGQSGVKNIINVNLSGSTSSLYPSSSWRCSSGSDVFIKKVGGASLNSKSVATPTKNRHFSANFLPVPLSSPLPQASFKDLDIRRKASESLEVLNRIPKDVIEEVNAFCVVNKDRSTSHNDNKPTSVLSNGLSSTAIWTCGQNSYGELGHGDVNLRRSFSKASFFDDKSISCVGAGNEHSVFISSSGKTFVAGYNDNGQCGIGTTQQVRQPTVVSFLEDEEMANVYVFNGCEHTLVVTTEGKMFSFGYNYRGQLGVGNTCSEPVPRPIRGLLSRKVAVAACSYHHSIVACVDGTVFSFGRNDCGQLGHGDTTDKKVPSIVHGLQGPVISVSCGQFHTIIVTKAGNGFACGKNDYGQLGLESSENVKLFSPISPCPEGDSMLQVCCGYYHSILLSQSGSVYGFGRNDYGQLGLGHTQPRMYGVTPNLYLRDKNVLSLAAGCYHSVAVTTNGMLYVFGRNNHGQLGTGDVDERHFPHPVDDFVGKKIIQVAAGFYHTIVLLATQGASNQENLFEVSGKPSDLMDIVSSRNFNADKSDEQRQQPNSDDSVDCDPQSSRDPLDFAEQSLNNNNRDCSVKVVNSLEGLNIEFKDLFLFTMMHLEESLDRDKMSGNLGEKFWSTDMKSEDGLVGMNWVSLQMNTFTVLLQMCRQYLNGSLAIDIPFSQEEILLSLSTLVNLFDSFVAGLDGSNMVHVCKLSELCHDDENFSELLAHYSPSFPVFNFDYFVEKLSPAATNVHPPEVNATKDILDELKSSRAMVVESIRNIRQEMFFLYFYLSESFDVCSEIGHQCGTIISKNFEFLFWSPTLRTNFFSFLAEVLIEVPPPAAVDLFDSSFTSLSSCVDMDSVDYSRSLNLLTKICVKYRNLSEVIDLFRHSISQGLEIYHKILKIYHHMCTVRVKNACDGVDGQDSNEFGRIINLLEHCCTHFTKCAIPLIFDTQCSGQESTPHQKMDSEELESQVFDMTHQDGPVDTVGRLVIDSLFTTAEVIIDMLSALGMTKETKDIISSETNLPIILPTFLLYTLSNVKVAHFRYDVAHSVTRLIGKLQYLLHSLDLDYNLVYKPPPSPKKRMEEMHTLSRGAASDSNPQKKEFSQTPWWVRLLKLCSILSAKLSCVLVGENFAEAIGDSNSNFSHHGIWRHWSGPENVVDLCALCHNEASTTMVDDLAEFRRIAVVQNHTYRTIISAAKANKTLDILNGIESCIVCALQQTCDRRELCRREVDSISSITTSIFNRRSVLMSSCEGLAWKDILFMVYKVARALKLLLGSCTDRSSCKPLLVPTAKRVHPALRRSLLVVMCLNRWKSNLKYKFKLRKICIISSFQYVLNRTIFLITPLTEKSLMTAWNALLVSLQKSDALHSNQALGMESTRSLLVNTPQSSIRIDVMSLLAVSWKKSMLLNNSTGTAHASLCKEGEYALPSGGEFVGQSLMEFSSGGAKSIHKSAFVSLVNVVQDSLDAFCKSLCDGTIAIASLFTELNLFYCNIKFLQLVVADKNNPYSFNCSIRTLKHLKEVLVAIDEKFAELQLSDERGNGSASSTKRQSSREKCAYMRRAASAIVRLLQIISMSVVNTGIHLSHHDFVVILEVHIYLMKHFQNIRLAIKSDSIASYHNDTKDGRGKDVNSHRRRCQELIINPMQFGRVQEGFVVQGEKLLSNFKGIDFTLACWVFITKNTASRSSFLVGKVSHNDAWPLVTMRAADMKVEIIFGRANEFERLSSHASVPLHTWTHVAVVVEPRKIKLFINGSMDCQVTTAGNARAILYPVIIGACPPGVRTRVDCIKEGFDGLMSNLKYYTRALSPIHVRVIFDKGPPEAHDARENLSYQLLSSCAAMLNSRRLCRAPELCGGLLETCHSLFLSDSSRLRLGALKALQNVLTVNVVEDFTLSRNELNFIPKVQRDNVSKGKVVQNQSKTVMSADFLNPFANFQERVVFYFIRLMGICWYTSTFKKSEHVTVPLGSDVGSGQPGDFDKMLEEFSSYCPSFVCSGGSSDNSSVEGSGVTSEGGAIEIPIPREDLIVEMCQAINELLRPLTRLTAWSGAVSHVLQYCTSQYLNRSCEAMTQDLTSIDMFGVSVFVGELPMCPFLGADVRSSYCEHPGTVLSIDKATSQSTLLTLNSSNTNIQLVTVKVNDLCGVSEVEDTLQLSQDFNDTMIALIIKLSKSVACLMTDCLSVSSRDQSFTHDYILKSCRPWEVFLFHQLLRRLSRSVDDCSKRMDLFDILKSFSLRATNNHILDKLVARGRQLPDYSCQYSFMWIRSLHYISAAFGDQKRSNELDIACSDENDLCESVLSTHLDISPDAFKSQYCPMLRSGHLTEFIHCASALPDLDITSLIPHGSSTANADVFTVDICSLAGRSDTPNAKTKIFFQMLFELRELIIKLARKVVHSEIVRIDQLINTLHFPWKVALWQSILQDNACGTSANDFEDLSRLSAYLLKSDGRQVTSSFICCIQFALTTLFRRKANGLFEMSENILQSTDVFNRLLLAGFVWLRTHENLPYESEVCYEVLAAFLPLLPLVEGMHCELSVLSLCALAVQRIVLCLYNGQEASTHISNFVKSDIFSRLWSRAQEHLVLERGHSTYNFSSITQHLVSIASGFSILQRINGRTLEPDILPGCLEVQRSLLEKKSVVPKADVYNGSLPLIKVRVARSHSAEFDISATFKLKDEITGGVDTAFLVHVVICVHGDGASTDISEDGAYETIYHGSAEHFVHFGLSPSSLYCLKYRIITDHFMSHWSDVTEFRTELGTTPFVFDANRGGADITVSEDGRNACYKGDDNWSTVLGSTPFTSGINSWEVKIVNSSTAYIFVGIASSSADVNTFLGGCSEGWGFIGEQALYHGREKVKIYGEPFSAGDVVGVILDFNSGTLSFTRNGKTLGIAFDKIYGELFPAIAFYNVGQEVEIVSDSFRTFCPPVPFSCSPSIVNLDQFSVLSEMMHSMSMRRPFSIRVLGMILTHLQSWSSGSVVRKKAVSGRYIFLHKESQLLRKLNLACGDRVRTQYGIATICGSAYGRVWFTTKEKDGAWYFSKQQISAGRTKGLFQKCSYQSEEFTASTASAPVSLHAEDVDLSSLQEYLDPERWSTDMDNVLMNFLQETAEKENITPWDISSQRVCDNFRKIQLNFSRFVMDSVELSHKWGISGPKRKAVLARLAVFRLYNHLLEHSLPLLLPSVTFDTSDTSEKISGEDLTFTCVSAPNIKPSSYDTKAQGTKFEKKINYSGGRMEWPIYHMSWDISQTDRTFRPVHLPNCSPTGQLCSMSRNVIFSDLKRSHFWKILLSSTARVSKTDDDYDYPEDLPLVKLNRFQSFRAVEVAEQMNISGEDLILTSMFCQLWKELRQHSPEKLRISYTHPMDDGQSRTFKVRFEGEGCDDYGGPYREVFQKICEELKEKDSTTPACFLPILHPTPNWSAEDCIERYKYTFLPSSSSALCLDLFKFLGQLVGMALRSKMTLELPLASYIWKSVVREPLTNHDIASFDAPASRFVDYIGCMHQKIKNISGGGSQAQDDSLSSLTEELGAVLQDVTWTVTFSDGRTKNLIDDGHLKNVNIEDTGKYLQLYTEARLGECYAAVEAFRKGLLWVIPESAISVLAWEELEYLVCGPKFIDVGRLKNNTEYDDDVAPNDPHIINFWEVLESFSEKEKSFFLRFVWARPTLPPNGIDFPQKLKIQSAVGDDSSASPDSYLPKAHTCFFSINLPRYSTKEVMKERLLYAVTHCTEMDSDFRVAEEEVVGWSSIPAAQNWTNYAAGGE